MIPVPHMEFHETSHTATSSQTSPSHLPLIMLLQPLQIKFELPLEELYLIGGTQLLM